MVQRPSPATQRMDMVNVLTRGMPGAMTSGSGICGCPAQIGGSCTGDVWPTGDGVFIENQIIRLQGITDGTSNTYSVGEFSRFKNDPDAAFNQWNRAAIFASSAPNTTRTQGLASSCPRINAPLQIGNNAPGSPFSTASWQFPTGDLDSWLYIQNGADYRELGNFGFRSQHPGGANFLFADGSVHFLKDSINMGSPEYSTSVQNGVYRNLSSRAGGEIVGSDGY